MVKNMSKAYIVYQSWNALDDSSPIAVFLDEKKCDEFIAEKNKDWYEDNRRKEECEECRCCDYWHDEAKDGVFLLKDACGRANIKNDRYGMYCENDMYEYHRCSSDYYSKYEIDLMD